MKIFHLINSLGAGGAERVLSNLCINDKNNTHVICTLLGEDEYSYQIKNNSIRVYHLNILKNKLSFLNIFQLYLILKKENPEILQSWLYHSDLIGSIFGTICGIKKIIWNIRHTDISSLNMKNSTKILVRICAIISKFVPNKIIYCSKISLKEHEMIGYNKKKSHLIYNGVDINIFKPTRQNKDKKALKSKKDIFKIGMVARFNHYKNHIGLIDVMKLLELNDIKFHCYLIGKNIDSKNKILVDYIHKLGISNKFSLLGYKDNMPDILNMLDLHILLTYSESFPNVIAEAMSCGVPCISSNEGEAKKIISKNGYILKGNNKKEVFDKIIQIINIKKNNSEWVKLKRNCKMHIEKNFSLQLMIDNYNRLWKSL